MRDDDDVSKQPSCVIDTHMQIMLACYDCTKNQERFFYIQNVPSALIL